MESQTSVSFRDLESLRRRAVALREREDRDAREYQSRPNEGEAAPDAMGSPSSIEVITGRARRKVSAEN